MSAPSRVHRVRDGRIVGGVCGGLARDLGIDLALVRAVAVLLGAIGVGIVVYAALVLVVPEDGTDTPLASQALEGEHRGLAAGVAALLVVGLATFDGPFGWLPGEAWPLVLLAAGGVALAVGMARRAEPAVAASPATSPAEAPGPAPEPDPSEARTTTLRVPDKRHAGVAGAAALSMALLAFGVAGGVLLLADVEVGWDVVLAGAVMAVGVLLLVAAPFGGARALVPLGFALAAVAGVAAAADLELEGGVGERTYRPASVNVLPDRYELSAGKLEVDLRDLRLPPGATVVEAQVGFGELLVRVPANAPVQATAHAAGGELDVLGEVGDGLDVQQAVDAKGDGPATGARLVLDAEVGFGEVTVVRGDEQPDPDRRGRAMLGGILTPGGWR